MVEHSSKILPSTEKVTPHGKYELQPTARVYITQKGQKQSTGDGTYDSSEKLVVSDDDEPFMPNAFCGNTTCSRGT